MLKQLFCNHRYLARGGRIGRDENVTYYECEKCGKEIEVVEKAANKSGTDIIEENLKEIKDVLIDNGYTEEEISELIQICSTAIDLYDLDRNIE